MLRAWERALARWVEAGLIDPGLEARIRAYQQEHPPESAVVRPMIGIALALGGVLIGAGVLLFVSANWDALSPSSRFGLVVLLVAGFHVAAVAVARRFPALTPVLHALGTLSLGAGIFLAGQIFNIEEHWPGGVMLWAAGSVLALALLRDQAQAGLAAVLVPAWLLSEWAAAGWESRAPAVGVFLLAVAYLTVPPRHAGSLWRPLRAIGVIALIPAGVFLSFMARTHSLLQATEATSGAPDADAGRALLTGIAWAVALGLPFALALLSSGRRSARWALAAAWTLLLLVVPISPDRYLPLYLWAAVGCVGLAWWGLIDRRPERVNLAVAGFALTVLFFYFDSVMDKMGRSASLVGIGVLFLAGGYALERARRQMIARVKELEP